MLAHRGQAVNAASLVSAVLPRAREVADPQTVLPLLVTAALAGYAHDDLETAEELLGEHEVRTGETRAAVDTDAPVWLVMVALRVGGVARAEAQLSRNEPRTACGRHARTHARALVAEAAGRPADAAQLFADAARGWKEWGSVPLRAYALVGLGTCSGDPTALDEGLEIFAALGAMPLAALAA